MKNYSYFLVATEMHFCSWMFKVTHFIILSLRVGKANCVSESRVWEGCVSSAASGAEPDVSLFLATFLTPTFFLYPQGCMLPL